MDIDNIITYLSILAVCIIIYYLRLHKIVISIAAEKQNGVPLRFGTYLVDLSFASVYSVIGLLLLAYIEGSFGQIIALFPFTIPSMFTLCFLILMILGFIDLVLTGMLKGKT